MRIMCLDYGTKRIGVAVSDPSCTISHPLDTVLVRDNGAHLESLKKIIRDYQVERIVVGLPYDMDGKEGRAPGRSFNGQRTSSRSSVSLSSSGTRGFRLPRPTRSLSSSS
jgi:putative transcription antitermination factor YqgF